MPSTSLSNASAKTSSLGFLVNRLTTTVTISDDIMQVTPISGEQEIPFLIALPNVPT